MKDERSDRPLPTQEAAEDHAVPPERSAYSDAYYSTAPREGQAGYGYNPARYYAARDSRGHRGQVSIRVLLAVCLACVIAAGLLGAGGLYLLTREHRAVRSDFYAEVPQMPDPVGPLLLQEPSVDSPRLSGEDIYVQACGQVVSVSADGRQGGSLSGSGIIVSADGYILTNYHLIQTGVFKGWPITVTTFAGDRYEAQIVGAESDSDIAVLKVEAQGLSPAVLGSSDGLIVGQRIYAVGNPSGVLSYTMTRGIVSARDRLITTDENVTANMFQFDAAVNNGNSGGPIYNEYGQVVGVATAKYTAKGVEGLGFAIPSEDAAAIANDLITKGYVTGKAYLGLTLRSVTPAAAQYFGMVTGAYVSGVEAGSAAETAGLQVGDIITAVGDQPVNSADEMVAATHSYHAGDTAALTVFRQGTYIAVSVTFGELAPPDPAGE